MKTLTSVGINKQAQRFKDSLSHVTYELGGQTKRISILKTSIVGSEVKVYVFFDDSIAGEIGEIKLIDKDGDIVSHVNKTFIKPQIKGLYQIFKYKYKEVEVEIG